MGRGEKLQQFKDEVISKLGTADAALMEEGTARLLRSGMVARTSSGQMSLG